MIEPCILAVCLVAQGGGWRSWVNKISLTTILVFSLLTPLPTSAASLSDTSILSSLTSVLKSFSLMLAAMPAQAIPAPISVQSFAQSQRIDQLANTVLSNVTVHGISGITASDIASAIASSVLDTLTATTATITNLIATTITGTNATFTNATTTNATSTNLAVTGTGYFKSNVGIGTTSPERTLSINGNTDYFGTVSTVANTATQAHYFYENQSLPSSAISGAITSGLQNNLFVSGNGSSISGGDLLSAYTYLSTSHTGTLPYAKGIEASIYNTGSGNITGAQSFFSNMSNLSDGTITNLYAFSAGITTNNGTITNYRVFSCEGGDDTGITNSYCLYNADANKSIYTAGKIGVGTTTSSSLFAVSNSNSGGLFYNNSGGLLNIAAVGSATQTAGSVTIAPGISGGNTLAIAGFNSSGISSITTGSSVNRTLQIGNTSSGGFTTTFAAGSGTNYVGIATTTPWRTLSVTGTVGFDGLTSAFGSGSLCLTASKEVVYNAGSDSCLSSIRSTKHDITALGIDAFSQLAALQPVSFIYNNDASSTVRYGFIAEDTAAVDSHLATYGADGSISGVDDRGLIAITVKALQQLITTVGNFADSFTTKELTFTRATGDEIDVQKTQTHTLCLDDICITRDQLQNLLNQSGQQAAVPSTPAQEDGVVTEDATTTATTTEVSADPMTEIATTTDPVIETDSTSSPQATTTTVAE